MGEFDEGRLGLPALSERVFGADGYARVLPNFEHRPEQERMALNCAQAFAADTALLCEAGTGVGKSMAYLVPGIIAAVRFRRQLVVATHTIALQQQIIEKDIPRIRAMFEACGELSDCKDFKAALLMGRANYLCTHRLKRALAERRELFDTRESKELERIADWSVSTDTGFVEEMSPPPDPEVWNWVNADSSSCAPRNCSDGTCFYQKARRLVGEADVVVLNHKLLFSMLAAGMSADEDTRGILFAGDMLVVDEAHLAPDSAADCFGISLSSSGVSRLLKRIYDPSKKKGLIVRNGMAEFCDKQIVCQAIDAVCEFFSAIKTEVLGQRETVRLTVPDWADMGACGSLDTLVRMLDSLAQNAKTDTLAAEIKDYRRQVAGIRNSMEDCASLADKDCVYWAENAGGKSAAVRLNSAPIDVSEILRRKIFARSTAVVMTSATLAIDATMDSFSRKVGAECAETFICKSPFDYARNMRVLLDVSSAEPDRESGKLDCKSMAETITNLALQVRGGTLVLFTSYYELNKCAEILEADARLSERNIYVQGKVKRNAAVRGFASDGNAVLLGTDTFWTGIDVPGEALSQVIIARLPFENFKHPLAEARMERAEALGENPFLSISLPNAVIKFRQGVGRLIRAKTDKGIIVVLDSRMANKHYGLKFASALPTASIVKCTNKRLPEEAGAAARELGIA